MVGFATIDDLTLLWRPLKSDEIERAKALIDVVSDSLRVEGEKVGKNIDNLIADSISYATVVKSVVVDVVARTLMTSTNQEPVTQFAQSALGYSVSGSYLVPGGGLFIKESELKRLGFRKQRYGVINFYD